MSVLTNIFIFVVNEENDVDDSFILDIYVFKPLASKVQPGSWLKLNFVLCSG